MDIRNLDNRRSSTTILTNSGCSGVSIGSTCSSTIQIVEPSSSSSSSSSISIIGSRRKRRASYEVNDSVLPAKRAPHSQQQSPETYSQPNSVASVASSHSPVVVDYQRDIAETQSSSECRSNSAEYDFCALSSPISASESPRSCQSNSCHIYPIRGDITPHGNKRTRKRELSFDEVCCVTPTAELRQCPLPALSWANAADVWNLMCRKDERTSLARESSMLENHPGLQPRMRAILLDWLIEVCEVYKLHRETYYLAVDYLDRFLTANRKVQKTHLQLIGITCLFVAAKVEEIYPPKIGDFAYVTDGACHEEDILQHELLLLKALDWKISPVTSMGWLGVYMQLNVSNSTPSSFSEKGPMSGNKQLKYSPAISSTQNSYNVNSCSLSYNNVLVSVHDKSKNAPQLEIQRENGEPSHLHRNGSQQNLKTSSNINRSPNISGHEFKNVNDSSERITLKAVLEHENGDTFIYPQFSGLEFAQTAQLIDLCSLDLGIANFPYSVVAAAAISHSFNRETSMRVSGYDWSVIGPCAEWMEPFFEVVRENPHHLYLMEQNDQVSTKCGLGHICPNIVTDDSHIIQTHSISMAMFDKAMLKRQQINAKSNLVEEASPAVDAVCPIGLLTPPASNRKPLENGDLENNPELTSDTLKVIT